ncbi:universal stress protein family protein [Streptomyces sp. SLBN-118]|uniref:universal stress protein n=1 Tax=Streptomyces sp. SLBN-118 TaxID=2768454 RepID=UPI00115291C3|nr:universal stress protein [Streptomyces sp. SLBN-118]TQK43565.1 universal stress protein family protein [Streptomyces sp. SLBN-118]
MTVLVGYVPTPEGEAALRAGIEETRAKGETLLVVNTTRGDALTDRAFAEQKDLDHVRRDLTELGVDFEIRQVVGGRDADEEILDLAASSEASLIVIGLRHRTPVGKLIMGSTAQRILLGAPCPVLAVKADS